MPATARPKTAAFNRANASNALSRVRPYLTPAMSRLADELLAKMEADGTVSIKTLHDTLFPLADTTSASAQLSKLLKAIEVAAEGQSLLIKASYKGAKSAGVTNRRLYFSGPRAELIADAEGLRAIPPEELITGQMGQVMVGERRIVLLSFNDHEFTAVRQAFWHSHEEPAVRGLNNVAVDDLGMHGGLTVLHYHSRQGNRASQRAVEELRLAYDPQAIIAVGIAFGTDNDSEHLNDVLVSTFICDYDEAKAHKDGQLSLRGARPPASRRLLDALRHLDQRKRHGAEKATWPVLKFGGLLSGGKLVDNLDYRECLKKLAGQDDIVGGEMEAAGIHAALDGHHVDWVVVKAICDWADGNKGVDKTRRQQDAAANAAQVVKALLDAGGLYANEGLESVRPSDAKQSTSQGRMTARSLSQCQMLLNDVNVRHLVAGQAGLPTELNTLGETPDVRRAQSQDNDKPTVVAFDDILAWVQDPQAQPLYALLGEYGMGKTTTCQRVAAALRDRREQGETLPLPLYFDLRKVERVVAATAHGAGKVPTLQESIEDCLRHGYLHQDGEPPRYEEVLAAIDQGALVIFDGLDEVLSRIGDKQGLSFTANLLKVLPETIARHATPGKSAGPAAPLRVLLSCRTQFFRNLAEQNNHLTGEHRGANTAQQYRALLLLPFTDDEIRAYLKAVFPDIDPAQLMRQIESVHNLRELAARPFTLKLVAQFIPRIEQWRAQGRRVTGATLYREVAREWLIRDKEKQSFQPEDKEQLAGDLAAHLWRSGQRGLSARELEAWLGRWLAGQDPHADFQTVPRDLLQEDLRNATFLKRRDGEKPQDSRFEFAHSSLQEFFLADHLLHALRSGEPSDGAARQRWALPRVSDETLDFLGQMLAEEEAPSHTGFGAAGGSALATLSNWRRPYLPQASELQLAYALHAHRGGWPMPLLVGMDLQGADLSDWHFGSAEEAPADPQRPESRLDMSQVELQGARLRRARFWQVTLDGARLEGVLATQAEFLACRAEGTQWMGTDLAGAVFRHTRLGSARRPKAGAGPESQEELQRWRGVAVERARFIHCPGAPIPLTSSSALSSAPTAPSTVLTLAQGHNNTLVTSCAISPDGRWLASAALDRTLRLWDADSGECLRVLQGHEDWVRSCAISPDGRRLASAAEDRTLRLWDADSGKCLRVLQGHEGAVRSCAISPDGRWLASAALDRTLRLWDADSGECLRVLQGHEGWVTSCAISPDGRWLASAAGDSTLRLWNADSGECLRVLQGHEGAVTSCAISPDGRWLASAAEDSTLRLWDADSGECLRVLQGHEGALTSCAISPDGRWLASAAEDSTLRLWDADSGECLRVHLSVTKGSAAWEPGTNRLLHARGRAWRHLAWQSRDGKPTVWPLEAGPTTSPIEVQPW